MRVLYVNHTAAVSGGERSLLTLLEHLPAEVVPALACPEGPLAERARALGMLTVPIPAVTGSLRQHPVHTPSALLELLQARRAALSHVKHVRPAVVHANSIRSGLLVSRPCRSRVSPALVHVRDVLPASPLTTSIFQVIAKGTAALVANSAFTLDAIPRVPVRGYAVHNPIDIDHFDPSKADAQVIRRELRLDDATVLLAVIAQITPWKAQHTALRVLAEIRKQRSDVHLLLVGSPKFTATSTRYDNRSYLQLLHETVRLHGLERVVHFLGERDDIRNILAAAEVVLLPSKAEPFGRVIAESMAMATPVLATAVGGTREIIRNGVDGLLLPPDDEVSWVRALDELLAHPARLRSMGANGRDRARTEFTAARHVAKITEIYRTLAAEYEEHHSASNAVL